jgi:hypothetical protein
MLVAVVAMNVISTHESLPTEAVATAVARAGGFSVNLVILVVHRIEERCCP